MMRDWVTLVIAAILLLTFTVYANAQEVTKVIDVSWQTEGAEPDVQYYQLYAGDLDTTLVKFGEPIPFNPNDANAPATISANYEMVVPAGETVTKWFSVTAIDTSGNESALAAPVSIMVDNQPPAVPTGLTVTIRLVVQ